MRRTILAFAVAVLLSPFAARADDVPAGLRKTTNATTGATDVAKGGFAAPPEVEKEKAEQDYFKGDVTLGGLVTAGNSRSAAFTAAAGIKSRLAEKNVLTFDVAVNYARAGKAGDATGTKQSVGNFQGRGRYERFFAPTFAGFVMATARYDKFQGLDLRFNLDPGVAYHFLHADELRLWAELGYDLQVDVRNADYIAAAAAKDPTADPVNKTEVRNAIRAFVGYDHTLRTGMTLTSGLEYLQGLSSNKTITAENVRVNWDVGLKAKIAGELAVGVTVVLKFDNHPLPGVQNADVMSGINLSYGFGALPKK
jgi:putative salt-induced outer membrane protein YdiY